MVPNLAKPPYTEIQRDIRLYAENLYFPSWMTLVSNLLQFMPRVGELISSFISASSLSIGNESIQLMEEAAFGILLVSVYNIQSRYDGFLRKQFHCLSGDVYHVMLNGISVFFSCGISVTVTAFIAPFLFPYYAPLPKFLQWIILMLWVFAFSGLESIIDILLFKPIHSQTAATLFRKGLYQFLKGVLVLSLVYPVIISVSCLYQYQGMSTKEEFVAFFSAVVSIVFLFALSQDK